MFFSSPQVVGVPACTLLLEFAADLKPADSFCFWVVMLNCSIVKMMVQDLCTKRIVNFTSFFCLGWSAVVDGQHFEVKHDYPRAVTPAP